MKQVSNVLHILRNSFKCFLFSEFCIGVRTGSEGHNDGALSIRNQNGDVIMEEILEKNEEREFCGFTEAPIIEVKGHSTNAWAGDIYYFKNNDQGSPFSSFAF